MEIKGHTIRVDSEVWDWLNALPGKSINEQLRSLMVAAPGPEPDARLDEILEHVRTMAGTLPDGEQVETILEAVMDRKIAARAQTGADYGSTATNHCVHCDQDYLRPAGQPPSSMCPQCRATGHWNTGNCKPCAEAKHLASVAALDQTGSGRDDIVYDA